MNTRHTASNLAALSIAVAFMAEGAAGSNVPAEDAATKLDEDTIRERHYFTPANLGAGSQYLSTLLSTVKGVSFDYNFDPASPQVPDGFGLLVQPKLERAGKGERMKLTGFIAAFVPDVTTIIGDAKGADYVQNVIMESLARKLKSMLSSAEPGEQVTLPTTLAGFIERISRSEGVATFNAVAKSFVSALKDANFRNMTKDTLRAVLMSKQFAEALYPKIPQRVWEALLDQMTKKANESTPAMDSSIFTAWKKTRDERSFGEVEEIDLSGLGISLS